MKTLFANLPTDLPEELVDVLTENKHVRIERIVSSRPKSKIPITTSTKYLLEWVGGEFDPEGFDVDEVTRNWHPFGDCQRREP